MKSADGKKVNIYNIMYMYREYIYKIVGMVCVTTPRFTLCVNGGIVRDILYKSRSGLRARKE